MKGYDRNVVLIGENKRECGLRAGIIRVKVCSRKDTFNLSRKYLFDISRGAYRNSAWKYLAFRIRYHR